MVVILAQAESRASPTGIKHLIPAKWYILYNKNLTLTALAAISQFPYPKVPASGKAAHSLPPRYSAKRKGRHRYPELRSFVP
jgi:hypothetical protein